MAEILTDGEIAEIEGATCTELSGRLSMAEDEAPPEIPPWIKLLRQTGQDLGIGSLATKRIEDALKPLLFRADLAVPDATRWLSEIESACNSALLDIYDLSIANAPISANYARGTADCIGHRVGQIREAVAAIKAASSDAVRQARRETWNQIGVVLSGFGRDVRKIDLIEALDAAALRAENSTEAAKGSIYGEATKIQPPDRRYLLPCGCPAEPFRVGWNTIDKLVQCFGCGKEYGVKGGFQGPPC